MMIYGIPDIEDHDGKEWKDKEYKRRCFIKICRRVQHPTESRLHDVLLCDWVPGE